MLIQEEQDSILENTIAEDAKSEIKIGVTLRKKKIKRILKV